jgi:uncharacterized protein
MQYLTQAGGSLQRSIHSPRPPHQRLVHTTPPTKAQCSDDAELDRERERFIDHIAHAGFPCVGARSAMNRKRLRFGLYGRIGAEEHAARLCCDLYRFQAEFESPGTDPVSFIALFDPSDAPAGEIEFEQALWQQLSQLHAVDRRHHGWDPSVSGDPASDTFSFSVGGRGMFVVGLHPQASRLARRTPAPTLVFNLHAQFEELRSNGRYDSMQRVIRKRDEALQGSINPVLARHGEASEAIQYSGRAVAAGWRCPFHGAGKGT